MFLSNHLGSARAVSVGNRTTRARKQRLDTYLAHKARCVTAWKVEVVQDPVRDENGVLVVKPDGSLKTVPKSQKVPAAGCSCGVPCTKGERLWVAVDGVRELTPKQSRDYVRRNKQELDNWARLLQEMQPTPEQVAAG